MVPGGCGASTAHLGVFQLFGEMLVFCLHLTYAASKAEAGYGSYHSCCAWGAQVRKLPLPTGKQLS